MEPHIVCNLNQGLRRALSGRWVTVQATDWVLTGFRFALDELRCRKVFLMALNGPMQRIAYKAAFRLGSRRRLLAPWLHVNSVNSSEAASIYTKPSIGGCPIFNPTASSPPVMILTNMPTAGSFPGHAKMSQSFWGQECPPPQNYEQQAQGVQPDRGKGGHTPQNRPALSDPAPTNGSTFSPDSEALQCALSHGSDCSTGRASCESCGEKLDADIGSIREMMAQTQEEDDQLLEDHFASHQTDLETLSQPISDDHKQELLSRIHAAFFLEALSILQLKYAIRLVRARALRRRAMDKVLEQALIADKDLAEHVEDIDTNARTGLLDRLMKPPDLDELDRVFDSDFPLLRQEGLASYNVVEQLEREHVVYIRQSISINNGFGTSWDESVWACLGASLRTDVLPNVFSECLPVEKSRPEQPWSIDPSSNFFLKTEVVGASANESVSEKDNLQWARYQERKSSEHQPTGAGAPSTFASFRPSEHHNAPIFLDVPDTFVNNEGTTSYVMAPRSRIQTSKLPSTSL
ncbi:hypothetical protein BKA70DRAFT_1234417 [Coprinopsis sp. MPI-PUGE-AT-0042]|nr:hypothetical protein BKA70DRAFT_1234417 [Coprinopsis sp. MPI-PUGE-AT-0042]